MKEILYQVHQYQISEQLQLDRIISDIEICYGDSKIREGQKVEISIKLTVEKPNTSNGGRPSLGISQDEAIRLRTELLMPYKKIAEKLGCCRSMVYELIPKHIKEETLGRVKAKQIERRMEAFNRAVVKLKEEEKKENDKNPS